MRALIPGFGELRNPARFAVLGELFLLGLAAYGLAALWKWRGRAGPLVATALVALAVATAIAWLAVDPARVLPVTFALLVVSCPCALSLATPAALAAAAGAFGRHGVLFPNPDALEAQPFPTAAIPGVPDLMHHKYIVRDAASVWTGSTNWTADSWTREENVILTVDSPAVAARYREDFEQLWSTREVSRTGKVDTAPVIDNSLHGCAHVTHGIGIGCVLLHMQQRIVNHHTYKTALRELMRPNLVRTIRNKTNGRILPRFRAARQADHSGARRRTLMRNQ